MTRRKLLLFPLLFLLAVCALPLSAAPPAALPGARAEDAFRAWLARQATIETMHASFIQERQLRTIRRPLRSEGRFWFRATGDARWELGDPPKMIAVQQEKSQLIVAHPKKKKALLYDLTNPAAAEKAQRLGFGDFVLTGGAAALEEIFTLGEVKQTAEGLRAILRFKERKLALAVLRTEMTIDLTADVLRKVALFFRDGSSITLTFQEVVKNKALPPNIFTFDTAGYAVEQVEEPE